jgi:hypothetical protein
VLEWQNVRDIDGLFSEIDGDSDGTLNTVETTTFMKQLQEAAGCVEAKTVEAQERIEFLERRIELTQQVVSITQQAEAADKKLKEEVDQQGVAARLGSQMLRKSTKINDLVSGWDSTDGEVRQSLNANLHCCCHLYPAPPSVAAPR